MKFIFNQKEFLKALQKVQKGVPIRTPLDILKGIYLELKQDTLILKATDLDLGIETKLRVQGQEDGKIILPDRIVDIVNNLPPGNITMEVNKKNFTATVKHQQIDFKINGFDPEEYPLFPERNNSEQELDFPGFVLTNILRKTLFAVANDQNKPAFNGVNFYIDDDILRATSSDTFRLSVMKEKIKDMHGKGEEFIIPAKSLKELEKLINEEEMVNLYIVGGKAIFEFNETTLFTSLIDEKFPDIRRVIPEKALTSVVINKNLLEMALDRANLLAESPTHTITLEVLEAGITIISVSSLGKNKEILPIKSIQGEEVTVRINVKFLNDVLKILTTSEIFLEFNGEIGPCLVKPLGEENYLYLALPVKSN